MLASLFTKKGHLASRTWLKLLVDTGRHETTELWEFLFRKVV
jgi:hypothetical protein